MRLTSLWANLVSVLEVDVVSSLKNRTYAPLSRFENVSLRARYIVDLGLLLRIGVFKRHQCKAGHSFWRE